MLENKPKSSRQRVGLIGRLSERVQEPKISDSAYHQKTHEHCNVTVEDTPGAANSQIRPDAAPVSAAANCGKIVVLTGGNNIVRPLTDDPRPGNLVASSLAATCTDTSPAFRRIL